MMMIMMIMSLTIIMTELGGKGDRTDNEKCERNITLSWQWFRICWLLWWS